MRVIISLFIGFILVACAPSGTGSSSKAGDMFAGMDHRPGFIDLYVDTDENRVYAKLPDANEDGEILRLIHTARLTAGLGSNPVGLDRGWGDSGKVVVFRKMGNRIILEAENLSYRASPDNPLEERAVRESFAPSFLASFDIRKSGDDSVIELTEFLQSDVLNLVQYLKDADQGNFSIAKDRTLVDTNNLFSFPDNNEIDVFFTLSSSKPGREVRTTAANGLDATLIQHHSFVRLPEQGYGIRKSDPRAGAIEEVHYDYSAALDAPIETRLARRYRLQKDADGKTINPIIFYIDSGAPEPIRSALVDGARWWEDAFAAAGYPDGYRVEILPEDAHPLDIRYNVVQWVHRQTRGWSYGGGVSDPRTGEMLKGHVNLGSLRVRQDRMIFEGLVGTAKTGTGSDDDPIELALDRIRQLSAHEVGHALGFAHNFAASTYNKGSVMDYPAPDVRVTDGQIDFSQTYGVGIGEWDEFAAAWLYGDTTEAERELLVQDALSRGLLYVADTDARSVGTSHPKGNVWDNGANPVDGLKTAMDVREIALENFGVDRIVEGQPLSDLNKVIVPIYLYHRYQTAAAAKVLGGASFNYALRGDGQATMEIVAPREQRAALDALLSTLDPKALDIPDATLELLMPSLVSYSFADSDRELFRRTAYPAFDVTAAADTAADLTFDALLDPRRAARLVEFNRRDRANPSLETVLEATHRYVMNQPLSGRTGEISKAVQTRFAYALMDLASGSNTPAVQSRAYAALAKVGQASKARGDDHGVWLSEQVKGFLDTPRKSVEPVVKSKTLPPGGPIGQGGIHNGILETCWHCD
ncbi:zinc-dependent metalloprotease [Fretibacter rubidus]|uniref:zinc-dependent metalloprotease n=1 Tax=Fretibacter rubidus TaxID=570162 RepID=UPI00352B6A4E